MVSAASSLCPRNCQISIKTYSRVPNPARVTGINERIFEIDTALTEALKGTIAFISGANNNGIKARIPNAVRDMIKEGIKYLILLIVHKLYILFIS